MNNTFLLAYVSNNDKSDGVVFETYSKFIDEFLIKEKKYFVYNLGLTPEELDFLTSVNPAAVIFDNIDVEKISEEVIRKIKLISPITHFIYFCEKFDKNKFLKVLKKGFEFCISLDFFDASLFEQTLINIFDNVVRINKINKVVIWGNNISMNLIDRKVYKSGHEIDVTKSEFEILKFFLEHPNVFFNNTEIFKNVWGYEVDTSNLVVQYIFKLNKKIGKDNILNSPNKGYCFKLRKIF
ncbi:MAG: winged helix-turn-helix domain-containing protein [Malacoplasma sp.]|nr:winged helix-turn-helix domain-containing protein [Malacoplasma sp.]